MLTRYPHASLHFESPSAESVLPPLILSSSPQEALTDTVDRHSEELAGSCCTACSKIEEYWLRKLDEPERSHPATGSRKKREVQYVSGVGTVIESLGQRGLTIAQVSYHM